MGVKAKEYDTVAYGRVTIAQIIKTIKVSDKVFRNWLAKYGDIDIAIKHAQDWASGSIVKAEHPCKWCGTPLTHGTYCGYGCRVEDYRDMLIKGTLPEHLREVRLCACGCEVEFSVVKGFDSRTLFEPSCKSRNVLRRHALKNQGNSSTWAAKYDRPELCKTCAKYVSVCSEYMTQHGLDQGWPCERKGNWDDYEREENNLLRRGAIDHSVTVNSWV